MNRILRRFLRGFRLHRRNFRRANKKLIFYVTTILAICALVILILYLLKGCQKTNDGFISLKNLSNSEKEILKKVGIDRYYVYDFSIKWKDDVEITHEFFFEYYEKGQLIKGTKMLGGRFPNTTGGETLKGELSFYNMTIAFDESANTVKEYWKVIINDAYGYYASSSLLIDPLNGRWSQEEVIGNSAIYKGKELLLGLWIVADSENLSISELEVVKKALNFDKDAVEEAINNYNVILLKLLVDN